MTMVSVIVAVDEANGMGLNNQLLCHLPADLQHFKTITLGKPIIMGRKTFTSIGKPLPGRLNIVVSKTLTAIPGITLVDSLPNALLQGKNNSEIVIIGGAQLFAEGMAIASRVYLTRIHHQFTADVFFPFFNESDWICRNKEFRLHDETNEFSMTFYTFEKSDS